VGLWRGRIMAVNPDENHRDESSVPDAALRALRTRDLLLSVLGHDVRNPLNTIVLGCSLLAATDADPKRRTTIQRMVSATQRMERLIRQALFVAQTLEHGVSLEMSTTDVGNICASLADEYRERYPSFKLTRTGDQHSTGTWDKERVVQLVDNLLSNAMRHGDGFATLDLLDAPDRAVISVHNQGRPIPQQSRDTLFDPLRCHDERSGGVRLGLYIVDQIIKAHKGALEFRSSESDGTTFIVSLPKVATPD
jgi:sigma-B regulation protein RsbU (phosphoserine phosphatase)